MEDLSVPPKSDVSLLCHNCNMKLRLRFQSALSSALQFDSLKAENEFEIQRAS